MHMEPDAVTFLLPVRQRGRTVGVSDTLEQELSVTHRNTTPRVGFNNAGLCATLVAPRQPLAMSTQQQDVATVDGDSMRSHQADSGIVQTKLKIFFFKIKNPSSCIVMHVRTLWVCDEGSNLQEESRTLGHEDESDECRQSRKQAHEYEQPPAVHLEL